MIAKNYIRYPEALRFQCELFSNGYKNSPRIMRLMTVIFDWTPTVPQWVTEAKNRATQIVRAWKSRQMELFETMKKKTRNTWTQIALVLFPDAPERAEIKTGLQCPPRFKPNFEVRHGHITCSGTYRRFCMAGPTPWARDLMVYQYGAEA